jgi:hypothetical protein
MNYVVLIVCLIFTLSNVHTLPQLLKDENQPQSLKVTISGLAFLGIISCYWLIGVIVESWMN